MADAEIRDFRQRGFFDKYVTGFFTQAGAAAGSTRTVADVFRQFFTYCAGFRFFITALHIVQYAFKRMATNRGITAIVDVFEFNGGFAGTVQDGVLHVAAQFVKRRFHVEIIMLTERAQHLEIIEVTTIPATDCAARQ